MYSRKIEKDLSVRGNISLVRGNDVLFKSNLLSVIEKLEEAVI